jgi:hypothetical protein
VRQYKLTLPDVNISRHQDLSTVFYKGQKKAQTEVCAQGHDSYKNRDAGV